MGLKKTDYINQARELGESARKAFRKLRTMSSSMRNAALLTLAEKLQESKNRKTILEANTLDIKAAESQNLAPSLVERLRFNSARLEEAVQALKEIAALPDPLGEVLQGKRLSNGIELIQKRVPLGVIFTIYESRPNVTIDVGALCIKSGNCAVLRGGKEAFHTNSALYDLFRLSIQEAELPEGSLCFVRETDRAFMRALLKQEAFIDLVVPRGGEQLIRFVNENSQIPVIKHDKGLCNLYIDSSADAEKAAEISINSKLQRTSVCNALENLIIHKDFPETRRLLEKIMEAGGRLRGCTRTKEICPQVQLIPEEKMSIEYSTEYLDERLSVKIVNSIEDALDFIFQYNSGHSEGIVSQDAEKIQYFQENADSAGIFVNCSTRFHDGGQMGFGAEIGISTGRLHVRGPMSLRDLTTSTFILVGTGQIRQ